MAWSMTAIAGVPASAGGQARGRHTRSISLALTAAQIFFWITSSDSVPSTTAKRWGMPLASKR